MDGNQVKKLAVISVAYGIVMIGAFIIMPQNPDEITVPTDLMQGFRIASGFSMSVFWLLLGIIFGSLWEKFKPHENQKITTF
jgi:predicted cobalt transporter CbtA